MTNRSFGRPAACRSVALIAAVLTVLAVSLMPAGVARAGQWMQVSCINPDGSAAPYEGWAGATDGNVPLNSDNNATCAPGQPMTATMLASSPFSGGDEELTYTPPAGSTLAGGTLAVTLDADAHSDASPNNGSGAAAVLAPDPYIHPADEIVTCAFWSNGCWYGGGSPFQATDDWSGTATLPSNVGGTVTVFAGCLALPSGGTCDTAATNGMWWARSTMSQADLLLTNNAVPQGSTFSGSALQPHAKGTVHLVFTASDPAGPGVVNVTAAVDGHVVYTGTPNNNNGHCAPVGTDPSTGALMFDWQQPCPTTEVDDLTIPTAGLPDGSHELTVTVLDAARNQSTVFDQQISTRNPVATPAPRSGIRARFDLSWRWLGTRTRLLGISSKRLPPNGHVKVVCTGKGCPHLHLHSAAAKHWKRLARELTGSAFSSGDKLAITVTAPHHRAERILITIRDSEKPAAVLR